MFDLFACPPGPQKSNYLLKHETATRSLQTQHLALARLIEPRHEAEQQPAA
jgi:hypothetical protein